MKKVMVLRIARNKGSNSPKGEAVVVKKHWIQLRNGFFQNNNRIYLNYLKRKSIISPEKNDPPSQDTLALQMTTLVSSI